MVSLGRPGVSRWEPRIHGLFYYTEDGATKATGGLLAAQDTVWFGMYGLGLGVGAGYSTFKPKTMWGWDGSSFQLVAYSAPVMLRFGSKVRFETGLNLGGTRFLARDWRPFAYLYTGISF